jgi:tetraprenyl-beta-curcumene synthase
MPLRKVRLADPSPLSPHQLWVLATIAVREFLWVLPSVAREVGSWRSLALAIPDARIREDALKTLDSERFNAEGAALFATLPRRRDLRFLRLLVTFQILLDFLDTVSEQPSPDPIANGRQLHLALVDALDPSRCLSDYYRHHPWHNDGGYLRALVQACRNECSHLPSYHRVRTRALRGAARLTVQTLNHDPNPVRRDEALIRWSDNEFPEHNHVRWWELTAAASSTLGIYALLALAADYVCIEQDVAGVDTAYMPWICAAGTMLDSYVDQADDIENNAHSYVAHYPDRDRATHRVRELVSRAAQEANALCDGTKHATIVAGMIAMYLSKDSARTPEMRATTKSLVRAGGSLARLLLPILRTWRVLYAQRSA